MKKIILTLMTLGLLWGCSNMTKKDKITIYTIGDSTVKNGQGDGFGGLWGWGDVIGQYFDTAHVVVKNHAKGGRSSRTYRTEGLWDEVLAQLKPGDYVLMQFGHNDNGALNDSTRARGTIRGIGDESEEIDNILTGKHETVHSYGWYMRKYVEEAKAKGAIPIIMTPIPRNDWDNGKVKYNDESYGGWAKQVAESEGVAYVELNHKMVDAMNQLTEANVTGKLWFKRDHTHTSAKGAVLAASKIAEGIKELPDCQLKKYLLDNPKIVFPIKKNVWIIGDSTVADNGKKSSKVGWGCHIAEYMDTTRVAVHNKARGGRSSRSYRYEGLWNEVLPQIQPGDFVLMQFGHNDGGNIDQPKYRGSIKGIGDSCLVVIREDSTQTKEEVHTYGWYMQKYISEAKAKGATCIVLSHIPRNDWHDGKVDRCDQSYGKWAKEAADAEGAFFINFNDDIAKVYEEMGQKEVAKIFPEDHTHTNDAGAQLNAEILSQSIKDLRDCALRSYLDYSLFQ